MRASAGRRGRQLNCVRSSGPEPDGEGRCGGSAGEHVAALVVAGGDRSELFHAVDRPLDGVALLVAVLVEAGWPPAARASAQAGGLAVGLLRDGVADATPPQVLPDGAVAIGLVGSKAVWLLRGRPRPSPPAPPPPGGRRGSATASRPGVLGLRPPLRRGPAAGRCARRPHADELARSWSRPRRPSRFHPQRRRRPGPAGAGAPKSRHPTTVGAARRPFSTARTVRAGHATALRSEPGEESRQSPAGGPPTCHSACC